MPSQLAASAEPTLGQGQSAYHLKMNTTRYQLRRWAAGQEAATQLSPPRSRRQRGMDMRRVITPLIGAVVTAVALAGAAGAVPDQGTPEFDNYMQGLERNGFHLNPDTAWRVAHQSCEGGVPGFIGWELLAQVVIGPGACQRLMDETR